LIAYLGLGSNVGDRKGNLKAAADALGALRMSSIYETAPQGEVRDQPDFLNAVVEIETELGPEELLARCKQIEADLGRQAGGVRHGPRPIDVDILLLGDIEYESERLRIPHRDLETRRFVLEPLMELAPERVEAARLAAVAEQRVTRVEGSQT
jgi:2-amino-4-hydroxy-6-hydroxymethyldihydropteridine diphosphokinase